MSRYYPGFLAALFIVLLRIAIGWHFLHEGVSKVSSTYGGKEPFSAEIYLRNANGPLAPYFRQMIPDVDSLEQLKPEHIKDEWTSDVSRISNHFGFDADQQKRAQAILDENLQWATYWFNEPANAEKLKKYEHDVHQAEQVEQNPEALSYQVELVTDGRRTLEADRRSLIAPLIEHRKELRDAIANVSGDQLKSKGEPGAPMTKLDLINRLTMYGLVAIGFCLMAGLFTPFAALCAAAFLAMIYLAMPPLPGLPPNPKAEGNYLIVSKNLVEMLACLVLATTPNGHWVGFDALLFGARRRRRLAAREARAASRQQRRLERRQPQSQPDAARAAAQEEST
jgi:uncharacterized membrane protein YphA (DoxX/SURF4 family)